MKKILLSILTSLLMISPTLVVADEGAFFEYCNNKDNKDKLVWVEKDRFCAPRLACDYPDEIIREKYCQNVAQGHVDDSRALLLVKRYIKNGLLKDSTGKVLQIDGEPISLWGNDNFVWVGVNTTDKGYLVFQFLRFSNPAITLDFYKSHPSEAWSQGLHERHLWATACWAYGKPGTSKTKTTYSCYVDNESECKNIAEFATTLNENPVNGKFIKGISQNIGNKSLISSNLTQSNECELSDTKLASKYNEIMRSTGMNNKDR